MHVCLLELNGLLMMRICHSNVAVEIISKILSYCDLQTLAILYRDSNFRSLVCKELSDSVLRTLSAITQNPAAFQSMMRRTCAVISGSTALYHVLRQPSTWQPSDVDLLVPTHRFREVTRFILAIPGAVIINQYVQKYNANGTGFSRILQVQTPLVKFDIIQSTERSPFHPIAYYYGTHVMNAITADFVICTYPTLTLDGKSLLVPRRTQRMPESVMRAVRKYIERGFLFAEQDDVSEAEGRPCSSNITCPHRNRAFGDQFCLVLPNGNGDVPDTWDLMDEHATTTWRLPGKACGNSVCYIDGQHAVGGTTCGDVKRLATSF